MAAALKLRASDHATKNRLAEQFERLRRIRADVYALADGADKDNQNEIEAAAGDIFDECGRQMLRIAEKYFAQ
jgi:hypothetical protein